MAVSFIPLLIVAGLCALFYWCGWADGKRAARFALEMRIARMHAQITMLINDAKRYLASHTDAQARAELWETIKHAESIDYTKDSQ